MGRIGSYFKCDRKVLNDVLFDFKKLKGSKGVICLVMRRLLLDKEKKTCKDFVMESHSMKSKARAGNSVKYSIGFSILMNFKKLIHTLSKHKE